MSQILEILLQVVFSLVSIALEIVANAWIVESIWQVVTRVVTAAPGRAKTNAPHCQ